MNLTPMRYKDYVWPHNPRTYRIQYQRKVAVHKIPFGRYAMQDMGMGCRVMTGEGEFFGKDAYTEFKKLASVFYREGPGMLFHPVWQSSTAYFVELSLAQEPREDYVRYTFTFWEDYRGYQRSVYHKLARVGSKESGLGVSVSAGEQTAETPAAETEAAAQPAETAVQKPAVQTYHTVVQGETLYSIAQKYGITWAALLTMNPQLKNPNIAPAGTRLRVG